jgi:hypothetical protein
VLSFQESSGTSARPEVDALTRVLRDLRVDDDIRDLQAAAGPQDAVNLGETGVLVDHEVDEPVGDDDVYGRVRQRQGLDERLVRPAYGSLRA